MGDIHDTLLERGDRYGDFKDHATISQGMKSILMSSRSWKLCSPSQKEALEMIAHKMARIVNGDPDYDDSWRDIIGYAQLVLDSLVIAEKA